MNLREDIERIKEVMGINESRDIFFKRRQNEFLDVLVTSFEWMDEFIEEMGSFEDYLKLILRHSIDAFFEFNDILVTSEEINELLPIAFKTLRDDGRLFRKVKEHYYSKTPDTTVTESIDRFLTRRGLEFNKYIRNHFGNVNPRKFDTFENYLDYVLQYAIMIFFSNVTDHSDLKRKDMEELAPIALHHLKQDQDLYDKIKNEYFKEISSEQRMNESKEIAFIKRRMDALLDYIEASYDWLSPRRFNNFDEFLKRVVYSATRDFVADHRYEIGGEYEDQLKFREDLEPIVLEFIKDHSIYDEIYDHFISNQ
jgi:hypothetical protein